MYSITRNLLLSLVISTLFTLATPAIAGQSASIFVPVGTMDDISYARSLWQVLVQERITGKQMQPAEPFLGAAKPHGWILELVYRNITVKGHTGFLVVKRNYDQEGLTVEQVIQDRDKHLSSFTVMFPSVRPTTIMTTRTGSGSNIVQTAPRSRKRSRECQ